MIVRSLVLDGEESSKRETDKGSLGGNGLQSAGFAGEISCWSEQAAVPVSHIRREGKVSTELGR